MKVQRILRVDVCDYENNILCNLYDNKCMIYGGAVDVNISTERNGWKELTFTIPTVCMSEEGEVENFRLDYLKAEYRLRTIDDYEEDYYIISEPKITHDKFSKDTYVRAGHVSQNLKTKNLDLEFSDEEGNNVGTARNFLECILEGTTWTVGEVFPFKERNGDDKVRTLVASSKTGAFSLIENVCELFDAVPIYHGGTRTVDLLPVNPFVKVIDGEIPQDVLDNNRNVVELHYGHSIKELEKTVNTENLVTRLYAYGSSGETYGIDIKSCFHNEYTFTLTSPLSEEYRFCDSEGAYYYFSPTGASIGDTLTWSMLDLTSRTYIRNNRTNDIYRVYKKSSGSYAELTAQPKQVQNWFPYISCFNYYDEIGLISDNILREIADFQRDMPVLYKASYDASLALAELQTELSETANPGDGFCKLDVRDVVNVNTSDGSYRKILLNNTQEHPDAVLWRSDYDSREEDYFQWHVALKLKENGDPTSGIGSIIFVVHPDKSWDSTYVKCIFDHNGNIYTKSNGDPKDYDYRAEKDYPSAIGVHSSSLPISSGDHVYLFCSNSMTGSLGSAQVQDEAIIQNIKDKTTVITEKHPVIFERSDILFTSTAPDNVQSGYGWLYRYKKTRSAGELYFCWGDRQETMWHRAYFGKTAPTAENGTYFFNTKSKVLYHRASGQWFKYETYDEQQIANMFSIVIYNCLKRDMVYKGLYENYTYSASDLQTGNYAFESEYGFYWLFTTDQTVNGDLRLDTTNDHIYQDTEVDHIVSAAVYPFDTVAYPVENEVVEVNFNQGSIDTTTGVEIASETNYRSSLITLYEDETYSYKLPSNSLVIYYDKNSRFIGYDAVSGTGTFTPITVPNDIDNSIMKHSYFVRLVVPSSAGTSEAANKQQLLHTKESDLATALAIFNSPANDPLKNKEGTADWVTVHTQIVNLQSEIEALKEEIKNAKWTINSTYYVRVTDYNVKIFANGKMYKVLSPLSHSGDLSGIHYLTDKFDRLATETYEVQLQILQNAQDQIEQRDNQLKELLGDMLREGWWQDNNYVEDDEDRLYNDAMDNLEEISKPEITYSFTYIDLFESEPTFDEMEQVNWPDIQITDVVHLTDPYITVNVWGYVDKINKCFDKPWETTIEINTRLSTIGQHEFTDVMARIASVAKEMKANQPIYSKANSLNADGTLPSANLEGAIQLHRNALLAERSNWYTDENNNMVFESADGQTAVLIGGRGMAFARSKNKDGDWEWRTGANGYGYIADEITAGTISADRIGAQTITVDKLSSAVGHDLDISTNRTLNLYATADGQRPAGSLKTTDSIIQIKAGDANTKAMINVKTGGELNLAGGNINIDSAGKLNIASAGEFHLRANGADNINATANGVYIGTDGVNLGGGKLLFKMSGDSSTLDVKAQTVTVGMPKDGNNNYAILKMDATNGRIDVLASANINITSGQNLVLLSDGSSGGNVKIGNGTNPFTIGADATNAYIYSGLSTLGGSSDGAYFGTDGLCIRGTNNGTTNYIKATKNGTVDITGKITATSGEIGGITLNSSYGIYTNGKTATNSTKTGFLISKDGGIYIGAYNAGSCLFQVTSAGAMTAKSGSIAGWTINATSLIGNKTGMAKTSANGDIAFWAGNTTASSANFYVRQDGYLVAKDIHASGGAIGAWTIGTKLLSASSGTSYVALDGSTDLYPLSGLSSPSDHMYAIWAGGTSPQSAPFSVTKDGIVTIKSLRVKTGDNAFTNVDMNSWLSSGDKDDDGYDFNVSTAMGKLKFQTIKSIKEVNGKMTIYTTTDNGGTRSYPFDGAASVAFSTASSFNSSTPPGSNVTQGTAEIKLVGNSKTANIYITQDIENHRINLTSSALGWTDNNVKHMSCYAIYMDGYNTGASSATPSITKNQIQLGSSTHVNGEPSTDAKLTTLTQVIKNAIQQRHWVVFTIAIKNGDTTIVSKSYRMDFSS